MKTRQEEIIELLTYDLNKGDRTTLRAFFMGQREINGKEYKKFEKKISEYDRAMQQPDKYLSDFLKNPEDFFLPGEICPAAAPPENVFLRAAKGIKSRL